jgi:hypothetical protein
VLNRAHSFINKDKGVDKLGIEHVSCNIFCNSSKGPLSAATNRDCNATEISPGNANKELIHLNRFISRSAAAAFIGRLKEAGKQKNDLISVCCNDGSSERAEEINEQSAILVKIISVCLCMT